MLCRQEAHQRSLRSFTAVLFCFSLWSPRGDSSFRFLRIKTSLLTLLALGTAPNSNHRNHKPPGLLPCNISTLKVVVSDAPVLVRATSRCSLGAYKLTPTQAPLSLRTAIPTIYTRLSQISNTSETCPSPALPCPLYNDGSISLISQRNQLSTQFTWNSSMPKSLLSHLLQAAWSAVWRSAKLTAPKHF